MPFPALQTSPSALTPPSATASAVIVAGVNEPFEAVLLGAPTGLTDLTVQVYDPGPPVAVILPATSVGITEQQPTEQQPGTYHVELTVATVGTFIVRWEWEWGTSSAEQELTVTAAPPYFTTAELRAQDAALADVVRFPDAQLDAMRALVEQSLEDACDVAFVPRRSVGTPSRTAGAFSGDGVRWLSLPVHMLRGVVSVTSDGQALDLTGVAVRGHCLWRYDGWPLGVANLTVTYSHGYDAPPLRVKRAALILAKVWLLTGPVDDRATQFATVDGSTVNLATPGVLGSTFGVPEVDAVVRHYRVPDARLT